MATVRRTTATAPVSASAGTKKSSAVSISSIKNADSGLKTKFDAKNQTLTISGTAKGKESRDPYDPGATSDYAKIEEFGGTISFDFDHEKMPKFDTSAGYTEKNKWYFAHSVEVPCKKGQTASQVLTALAAKVNASSGYHASVVSRPDGSATLTVDRKA